MENNQSIFDLFEGLTGQCPPMKPLLSEHALLEILNESGIGYTQFNELLLTLGYDRVERIFFNFIATDNEYKDIQNLQSHSYKISSIAQLKRGVERLQKYALLLYGNIKYGFKLLSTSETPLLKIINENQPKYEEHFQNRNPPVLTIQKIEPEKTYYLGYLIQSEIKKLLKKNKDDKQAIEEKKICQDIIKIGKKNNIAYLTSDYMDVYIATSMRLRHEFILVNKITDQIFQHESLKSLNLRWFDPTQAFCKDRIDKGLVEGLMLKRATCTIYLVQESDTFGKDSELASTLSQGKPVIAYIPEVNDSFFNDYFTDLKTLYPQLDEKDIIKEQLKILKPTLAWDDAKTIEWLTHPEKNDFISKDYLKTIMAEHYDKRAETLRDKHPLGLQVNISNGVAYGVLVVRNIKQCADLVKNIILNKWEFDVETIEIIPNEIEKNFYEDYIAKKLNADDMEFIAKYYTRDISTGKYLLEDFIDDDDTIKKIEKRILNILKSVCFTMKKNYYLKENISKCIHRVMTGDTFLTNSFWNFYLQ